MKRRVLITGASGGIGGAVAQQLSSAGFEVVLHYRNGRPAAEKTASAIKRAGGRARVIGFDVLDRSKARAALEKEMRRHGAFWGVVCSTGVIADWTLSLDERRRMGPRRAHQFGRVL